MSIEHGWNFGGWGSSSSVTTDSCFKKFIIIIIMFISSSYFFSRVMDWGIGGIGATQTTRYKICASPHKITTSIIIPKE
jgi:hypothetical protein